MTASRWAIVSFFLVSLCAGAQAEPGDPSHSELEAIQHFLVIPSTVAQVTDAYFSTHAFEIPEFILIQDVHRHPEVQGHIASLILQGYRQWGVKKVFLEGAFTGVDLSMFHRLPDQTRGLLLSRLVQNGDLSGAELATVLLTETEWSNPQPSPFQLFGMEDPKLYRQNIAAYQEVTSLREEALQEIVAIRRLQSEMNLPQSNILTQQLDRTETLIRLKLTPVDYEAYLQAREVIPSSPRLDPAVHAAEKFYDLVQRRSFVFIRQAQKEAPASPGPRVLVVGGFHTPVMARYLRESGRSFVVLTPHVTKVGYGPLYEEHMMESVSALNIPEHPTAKSH